jgi:cytochrome c-type biogenesis protein
MLPIYVSYFAGDGDKDTKRVVKNALGFIFGFTAIFVALGALAGTVGQILREYKVIVNIVTGAVVIFFGLNFLGVFKLNIFKGTVFSGTKKLGFFSSVLFGIVFSIGWTPCVGAFLGSALMMAASGGHMAEGMLMLFVYSLGLGIPFFISAILIDKLKGAFVFIKKNYSVINVVSGVLLVAVGILMATGFFGVWLALLA